MTQSTTSTVDDTTTPVAFAIYYNLIEVEQPKQRYGV